MIYERDVRKKIAAVLASEISIGDFARWIMSNSWNMHKDSSDDAIALVSDVHLLLAERDDFSINDSEFLAALSGLVAMMPPKLWVAASVGMSAKVSLSFDPEHYQDVQTVQTLAMPTRRWSVPELAEV